MSLSGLSLRWKLTGVIIIFGTVITGILSAVLFYNTRNQMRADFRQRLEDLTGVGALSIQADLHQTLLHPGQENNSVYTAIKNRLQAIKENTSDIHFVYTMRAGEKGQIEFVVDAETDPDSIAHLGDIYTDASPFLSQNFSRLDAPVSEQNFYSDRWGTWLTGYAPFFNASGKRIGVLGVDIKAAKILQYERKLLFIFIGIFSISIILSVLLGIFLGSWLSAPILAITSSAERIGQGDFDIQIPVKTHDELGVLSHTFNAMTQKIKKSIIQLKDENIKRQVAENKFRSIFENAMEGIYQSSFDRQIIMANPEFARMLGYESPEDVLHNITDISSQLYAEPDRHQELLACLEAKGQVSNFRIRVLKKDGSEIWTELNARVVEESTGFRFIEGLIKDISEQLAKEIAQEKEAAAKAASLAKSEFLANMSHEIRTPMNAVLGLTHLALKTDLSSKQKDYLNKIMYSAQNLLNIINDILDFSKIEAGKLSMETINFDMENVMNNLAGILGLKAEEKGLEILFRLDKEIPDTLIGDPLRLQQILTNLINNAIKFTETGTILLSIQKTTDEPIDNHICIKFSIKDTGIGLTREQADTLFQSFSQADASITRKYGGTGLGLTICKRLVEMMKGEIQVDSLPGQGSTFSFTAWLGLLENTNNKFLSYPADLKEMRVLAVDDNSTARDIIGEILESFSFRVSLSPSGEEALAELEQVQNSSDPYKLVIMDWKMPGKDGIETAAAIQAHSNMNHIPHILMLTAYGREDIRQKAELAGVSSFLIKPVNPSLLFDAILSIFSKVPDLKPTQLQGVDDPAIPGIDDIRGARILLVEDNEINRQVATELLESEQFIIEISSNGRKAVDRLSDCPPSKIPDAVLMDIQMPEMDGYTATQHIRKKAPPVGHIPIIAMTAHALEGEKKKCFAAGMDDHVAKPIDPQILFQTLVKWIKPKPGRPSVKTAEKPKKILPPETFATLTQFDIKAGLNRVAGNHILYMDLLNKFALKHHHADEAIKSHIDLQEFAQARDLAHAIKGSAGNLGAGKLQQAASVIETVLIEKNISKVLQVISEFTSTLKKSTEQILQLDIHSATQSTNPVSSDTDPMDTSVILELTAQIKDMITADYSLALEKTIELIPLLQSTPAREPGQILQNQMDAFEEKAAIETLHQIIKILDKT